MDTVDKIYSLINENSSLDTFNNNVALFQEFYYHNMSIRYGGSKVITIYQYLLSLNISEEHETMPYINSKIFDDFNNYIIMSTQSVYNRITVPDDDFVEALFCLINDFYLFKNYNGQGTLNKLLDENTFIRDCTGAMIIALNSNFFNLSNDNIKRMMDFIKNNSYLKKIIEDGIINNRLLDKDYFYQYLSRFLFNAEFLSRKNIENDIIINAIKEARFKDKDTLTRIFKTIDLSFLLEAFDNGLTSLVDILEKSIDDEYDRFLLFRIVYNKLLDGNCYKMILSFLMKDGRSNFYFDSSEKDKVIDIICDNYFNNITEDEVNFLLDVGVNELFLINLKRNFNRYSWSDATVKRVQEATDSIPLYDIDFETAIGFLDSLFTDRKVVDFNMLVACLERLIKTYLNDEDIKVYIVKNKFNGCTVPEENCIMLNADLINRLLIEKDYEGSPEALHILETIFHEARHIQQFNDMKNASDDNMYAQYKEDLLINLLTRYYDKNYFGVSLERDARINGAQMVVELFKQYFPYMKQTIRHYSEKVDIEASLEVKRKRVFELSDSVSVDDVLGKLISINPELINKFIMLSREYNIDGTKKVESNGFKP